jgi:transcriptional regulator with XRE-family HTH domain
MARLKIKELAEERGYNMSSLSRKADVSFSTVKRLWRDPHRPIKTDILEKIARALGVPLSALFDEDEPET